MIGVRAEQSGTISSNFVGDEAAAGHGSVLSSQFSVKRSSEARTGFLFVMCFESERAI
jgi:hypothetical protein